LFVLHEIHVREHAFRRRIVVLSDIRCTEWIISKEKQEKREERDEERARKVRRDEREKKRDKSGWMRDKKRDESRGMRKRGESRR